MILYREGELIDCDEDSTIVKMFTTLPTTGLTETRSLGAAQLHRSYCYDVRTGRYPVRGVPRP